MDDARPTIPSLTQSWAFKLYRAQDHLQWLNREAEWLRNENPCALSIKFDEQTGENVIIAEHVQPVSPRWGLVIGDCVHNLRSALDSLVWFLVRQETQNTPGTRTEFPVFSDAQAYGEARTNKTRGIGPGPEAVIENAQPYHRGDQYAFDPLWVLHELSRIDKHRHIHVTQIILTGAYVRVRSTVADLSQNIPSRTLVQGAEILRFPIKSDPAVDPTVDMEVSLPTEVAFEEGGIAGGLVVTDTLVMIWNRVVDIVQELQSFAHVAPKIQTDRHLIGMGFGTTWDN